MPSCVLHSNLLATAPVFPASATPRCVSTSSHRPLTSVGGGPISRGRKTEPRRWEVTGPQSQSPGRPTPETSLLPTAAAHTQQVAEELPTYPSGAALWLPGTFLLLVLGGSDLSGSFPAPCLSLSLMAFLNNSCTSPPALLGVRERCLHLTAADPHTVACEAPVFWAFEVELLG